MEPPRHSDEKQGGDQTVSAEREPESDAKPAPKAPPPLLTSARDGFELLGAGAEPRAVLRFAPELGQVERLSVSMGMAVSMATHFRREGMPGEVEVTRFDSRGGGRVTYELDKLVPPRAKAQLETKLNFALPGATPEEPQREIQSSLSLEFDIRGGQSLD